MARTFGCRVAGYLAVGGLLGLLAGGAAAKAEEERCQAPEPVCAVRGRVFRIAAFDPVASAVLVGPGLLVTNRHVVADLPWADVFPPGGPVRRARVVATDYPGDLVLLRAEGLNGGPALETATADAGTEVYAVGVDVGRFTGLGGENDARDLLKELGITYPAGFTTDGSVMSSFKVLGMPTTVFIDSKGGIFRTWTGALNRDVLRRVTTELMELESGPST